MSAIDFERLFEALPSPYMLLDRNLRYVAANHAYLATTQRTMEELRGQHIMEMFPNSGESGRRLLASFEKVLATGEPDTLAYLNYPISRPDGTFENRYWTAVHTPVPGDSGAASFVLQNTVDVTELARLREAASLPFAPLSTEASLIERAREAEAANADFRRLFQQAPAFFAILSGPQHVFIFTSDSYVRLIGGRNVIGQPIAEALPEMVEQGFVARLDEVYREGIGQRGESERVMLANTPGRPSEEAFLDFTYEPIRNPGGEITGVFVQGMDRTESVRAQRRQQLLIDELNHRVKNTLAMVQSIASQTLRATSDVASARVAFEARIVALSKAHTMLSERKWDDTEIGRLAQQELNAYDDTRVQLGGPVLMVNAKTTIALALLLHELATNAVKYGSLSVDEGTLAVTWSEDKRDNLVIDWIERGGPPATVPTRRGFGSRMLEAVVTGELGGRLDTRFEPEGFSARLCIPRGAYRLREAQ